MTLKNHNERPIPDVVTFVAEAVSAHIGRDALIRQVKNRTEWWVTDALFSHVQHGARKGRTDYRAGFLVYPDDDHYNVDFATFHTPLLAKQFKANITYREIRDVIELTAEYRTVHGVRWSSRVAYENTDKQANASEADTTQELLADLDQAEAALEGGFVGDLFPVVRNRYSGQGGAPQAGHDFSMLLSDSAIPLTRESVRRLIGIAWPLFAAFYPQEPIQKRNATLARSMRTAGVVEACEFLKIQGLTDADRALPCAGALEGAHIDAHAEGGSDRSSNGLWLCHFHHQITEGRLVGSRSVTAIEVRLSRLGTRQNLKVRRDTNGRSPTQD